MDRRMKPGDVVSFETSYVVNPDPMEPLLSVGDLIEVGEAKEPYRVTACMIERGVQMFRMELVHPAR